MVINVVYSALFRENDTEELYMSAGDSAFPKCPYTVACVVWRCRSSEGHPVGLLHGAICGKGVDRFSKRKLTERKLCSFASGTGTSPKGKWFEYRKK